VRADARCALAAPLARAAAGLLTLCLAAAPARAAPGGPAAAPAATASGPFATQPWGPSGRIESPAYAVEGVTFPSGGETLVGNLFVPAGGGRGPAVAILGPVAFVKEQSPVQYASRLAREGLVALVFDPRHHGESGGEPRRLESGPAKVADLRAALDLLAARPEVDPGRLHILAICQGVNWGVEAAVADPRVRALALVAGHYLTPETALMYLGDEAAVAARLESSRRAEERFRATGEVEYVPIVHPSLDRPDPRALLTSPPIQQFYIRWADRGPFWSFHGLWENRIAAMSEAGIWGHRVDEAVGRLRTPTLMVHADRAASGPAIPRRLFDAIPAATKGLVWLGPQNQLQFYEDPITIDQVVPHVARFFAAGATRRASAEWGERP
jgi:uncharacterized protein